MVALYDVFIVVGWRVVVIVVSFKDNDKKIKGHRRVWTPIEKDILADLMNDLVSNSWKSEKGLSLAIWPS